MFADEFLSILSKLWPLLPTVWADFGKKYMFPQKILIFFSNTFDPITIKIGTRNLHRISRIEKKGFLKIFIFSIFFGWVFAKILEISIHIWWNHQNPSGKNRKNENHKKTFFFNTWIFIKIGCANFYRNPINCLREKNQIFLKRWDSFSRKIRDLLYENPWEHWFSWESSDFDEL